MIISLELKERFHEKWLLNVDNGCWEWQAATMGNGYGFIKIPKSRKQISAHRLSYLIHYGHLVDNDMMVCHTCDNPKCVKPSHLFLGTAKENQVDMKDKDRHLKGVRNSQSKLTDDKVRNIHSLYSQGVSQGKIAKTYKVSQGTIWKIIHGERWNHIYIELNK